ncbi:hypothetical protein EVAR_4185_1 [Eumeta japonica]|uniref:Uncharacterized protein n=1 Tax=Eumeta variegata TaxID=151549 RepID=A0A4C1TJ13_EUMVA|nr:hypothetical protein EVAR_4185_1 [Eumeta japonica]
MRVAGQYASRTICRPAGLNCVLKSFVFFKVYCPFFYPVAFTVRYGTVRASGVFAERRIDCFYMIMRKRCASTMKGFGSRPKSILWIWLTDGPLRWWDAGCG